MWTIKKYALYLILLSSNVYAGDYTNGDHNIHWSGYVGYKQLISNNHITNTFSGMSTPELGLNIIYNNNNFQVFNQFRYGTNAETILVYNFAQYTFNLFHDTNLTIKGGKLRHDFGLYNTTRVNPITRQGVVVPQAIYWEAFQETFTSGAGVNATLQIKDVELSYTLDDPTIIDSQKLIRTFTGPVLSDVSTSLGSHQIASLNYTPRNIPLVIKSSFVILNFGNKTTPLYNALFPKLANTDVVAQLATLGVEYSIGKFIFAGEALYTKSPDKKWIQDFNKISHGVSFTGTYHINDNVDARVNYNEYTSAYGKLLNPANKPLQYQQDINIGLNYHVNNWMFQVEAHKIKGARSIDSVDINGNVSDYNNWYMVATNVVYSF
jgi:hypothetical protein